MDVLDLIWHGLRDSLLMAWEVWWALVLGFAISAIVQAWVPRERIEALMSGSDGRSIGWATGLGAASSSCSYAAVAIARSLFAKGASAASALAFQFASTNLVWELGLVLWVLLGWQFTVAEYVGGIVMIILMTVLLRRFVSRPLEQQARAHAAAADAGHQHHTASESLSWRARLTSARAWSDVAHNFRGDWQMLWKEITLGFLLAGFIAQFGNGFFTQLFIAHAPAPLPAIENVILGPLIAVLSFVCSLGNVPLAAVLWSGGISFGGVLAFLFADLIVLPILAIYRKYYGTRFALRITALMFTTMALAALIVDAVFSALGLIPGGARPTRADIFSAVRVDDKLVLNVVGALIFMALFWLTVRRGVTDPVCGMTVDRDKAVTTTIDGDTHRFCSTHCLDVFQAAHGTADAVPPVAFSPMTLRAFPVVYAHDVELVARFWERLGFRRHVQLPPDGDSGYIGLTRDGGAGELAVTDAQWVADRYGLSLGTAPRFEMYVYVEDLDVTVQALADAGVTVLRQAEDMQWGERIATVLDPLGNPVALCQQK